MDLIQELQKEIAEVENEEGLEIIKIYINKIGNRRLDKYIFRNFNQPDTICGYPLGQKKSAKKYEILTDKLYEPCEKCSQKKMYDEKYEKYYCPICDSPINRIKDKVYKTLE